MNSYQKVIRGRGSLKKLPEMMDKLNIRNPLIVGTEPLTGTLLRNNPFLRPYTVFSSFHTNPVLSDIVSGAETYCRLSCDGLVSVGGDSSVDTAKGIKARLNAVSEESVIQNRFSVNSFIPHIAVPCTAGTGSEATQFAVVYVDGLKVCLDHKMLRPDGVVLDSTMLNSLPEYLKKTGALLALTQGIESYWNKNSNDDSRVHAYLAIIGILDNLNAFLDGNPHAADEIIDSCFQSGKAIQMTKTAAVHEMSCILGSYTGIALGHACMLMLPVLWEMLAVRDEMNDILTDLSIKMRLGNIQMAPRLLKGIMYELGLPFPKLPDDITVKELADSVNNQQLNNYPVRITHHEVEEAFRRALTPLCVNEKMACVDLWRYYGR